MSASHGAPSRAPSLPAVARHEAVTVREIRPDEHDALGRLVVDSYRDDDPSVLDDGYAEELADVATRARQGTVLVALAGDELLGGVTYVSDRSSPLAEMDVPDAASFRMLGVSPAAQRRGAGRALVEACVARARAEGRHEIIIHSTRSMGRAHRLYERLGFRRDPSLDWWPVQTVELIAFRLDLRA